MSVDPKVGSMIQEDLLTKCSIVPMIQSDPMVKFNSRSWIPLDPSVIFFDRILDPIGSLMKLVDRIYDLRKSWIQADPSHKHALSTLFLDTISAKSYDSDVEFLF